MKMPYLTLLVSQLVSAHIRHNPVTGIATVGTSTYHGLSVNSKIRVAISTVGVRTDGDTGVVPQAEKEEHLQENL